MDNPVMERVSFGTRIRKPVQEAFDTFISETDFTKQFATDVALALLINMTPAQRSDAIEWFWRWIAGDASDSPVVVSGGTLFDESYAKVRELIRDELASIIDAFPTALASEDILLDTRLGTKQKDGVE